MRRRARETRTQCFGGGMSRGRVPVHVALSSDWSRTVISHLARPGCRARRGARRPAPRPLPGRPRWSTPRARATSRAVRSLLAAGADANGAHGDGMSALHWAAERGDAEMARTLVHAGAAVDAATRIGHHTPLHVAAAGGPRGCGRRAPRDRGRRDGPDEGTGGADPAAPGRSIRQTSPRLAALLDYGADVNAREKAWGQTPLIFAAASEPRRLRFGSCWRAGPIPTSRRRPSISSPTADWRRRRVGDQRSVLAAFEAGDARATPSQVQAAVLAGRERYLSGEIPEAEEDAERPAAVHRDPGRADGVAARGAAGPYRRCHSSPRRRGRHRSRVSGRWHDPAADGDDQRAVRPGPDAPRAGRRPRTSRRA